MHEELPRNNDLLTAAGPSDVARLYYVSQRECGDTKCRRLARCYRLSIASLLCRRSGGVSAMVCETATGRK